MEKSIFDQYLERRRSHTRFNRTIDLFDEPPSELRESWEKVGLSQSGEWNCLSCPFSSDLLTLCSHVEDEHSFLDTVSCPVCSKSVTGLSHHIRSDHMHLFRKERKRQIIKSSMAMSRDSPPIPGSDKPDAGGHGFLRMLLDSNEGNEGLTLLGHSRPRLKEENVNSGDANDAAVQDIGTEKARQKNDASASAGQSAAESKAILHAAFVQQLVLHTLLGDM